MRKSQARTRARLVRAGMAVGTVGAAALVAPLIAPGAAFAAVSVSPPTAPVGATVTIVDTDTTPFGASGTPAVELQAAACGTRYTAVSTSVFAVTTVVRNSASSLTFTVPSGAVANSNGVAKRYNVCVYDSNSTTTSARLGTYLFNTGATPTLSASQGLSGGENSVTVSSATESLFSGVTTIGAVFSTTNCGTTYGSPTANLATTATKNSDSSATLTTPAGVVTTTTGPASYELCLYGGTAASSALVTSAEYLASPINPSQQSGPSGGLNALTFQAATPIFAGMTALGVSFTTNATCGGNYNPSASTTVNIPVSAANVRKLADDRLAVTVPDLTTTGTFRTCVYNGNTAAATLIASARYTAATVQRSTAVVPNAGPAAGGNKITIVGTNFPTTSGAISATIGGVALRDITPISATAFSAVSPPHDPVNNAVLVVTTANGQHVLPNAYTYTTSLKVTPNTAPSGTSIDVIVTGNGFQSANWTAGLANAHIYLTRREYNPATNGSARSNPPWGECTNVLAFTDTQLVCTMELNKLLQPDGTAAPVTGWTITIAAPTVGSRVITGPSAAFTNLDIGMQTTDSDFPAGTKIVDVISPTVAIVSQAATAAANTSFPTVAPVRTGQVVGVTASSPTITGSFSQADVGAAVAGAAPAVGTSNTITSVNAAGTAATLATAVGATPGGATDTVSITATTLPVPEGAYNVTYVTSGSVNANTSSTYIQSVLSSSSTFTVSKF